MAGEAAVMDRPEAAKRPKQPVEVPVTTNDAQAGKAAATVLKAKVAEGGDPTSLLGGFAAGEIGAEKPLLPKIQGQEPGERKEDVAALASTIAEDPVYLSLLDKYKRVSLGKYTPPDGPVQDLIDRTYPEGVRVGNHIGEDELKALKEFEEMEPQRAAEYRKKSIDDFKGGDRENLGVKLYRSEVAEKIVKAQEDALQAIKENAVSQGKTEAEQLDAMAEQFWQIRYGEELKGYDSFFTEFGAIDDQGPHAYWFRESLQVHKDSLEWQFKDPTTVAYYETIAKLAITEKFGYPPDVTKEQLNQEFEKASGDYNAKYPMPVAPTPWATDSYREKPVSPTVAPPFVPVPPPVPPQEKGFFGQIIDAATKTETTDQESQSS